MYLILGSTTASNISDIRVPATVSIPRSRTINPAVWTSSPRIAYKNTGPKVGKPSTTETITLPPIEGGRTIAVDEVNLIAFVKKNGYSDSAKYINRGESFTFQGNSGGFYKIQLGLAEAFWAEYFKGSKK